MAALAKGTPSPDNAALFRAYHRATDRRVAVRDTLIGCVAIAAVVAAAMLGVANAPAAVPGATVDTVAPVAPVETVAPLSPVAVLPSPDAAISLPIPATGSGPRHWSISIDTTGYQAEIDQCLWVRMDLGLAAPVVGAHNYCGGSVVLEMAIGDTVTLSGTGLDGVYRVSAERLAWAGDQAAAATAGLTAAVILQTCFWVDDGSERLLALLPA